MGPREERAERAEARDLLRGGIDAVHGGVSWLDLDDEAHSDDELRYRAIGPIARGVVVVVYVERDEDVIRIISARAATPRERRLYEDWIERNP